MKRFIVVLAVAALIAPAGAAAHVTLIRTTPAGGAVLERAPQSVSVEFDDGVHVAPGNAAVANASGASVLAARPRATGHVLVVPLRPGLADGVYTVRWSVVSNDGHREQGVLAFAVGAGSAAPVPALDASTGTSWSNLVLRTLYFLGLLAAAGAAFFWMLARPLLGPRVDTPLAHLLFFALLATFLGGSAIVHSAPSGTRFALVLQVAITLALVGGAAAALAPSVPLLLFVAGACSFALLLSPTLAGHSLDRDQPRVLAPLIDATHLAGAAVWLGGLLALVYVLPRASADGPARAAVVRRFSRAALIAVLVIAASGLGRSLTELSAVHQVWSTSYGRALLVKTALFAPLLGLGWLNRSLLAGAFARLRRSALVEITLLVGIVVAVAVLTEIRPGVAPAGIARATAAATATPPVLPGRDAVVDARELGSLAVAVARTPGRATVTLLGPDGTGVDGRRVTIGGAAAAPCGPGCYRAPAPGGDLRVGVGGRTLTFTLPAAARDEAALLRRITRRIRGSKTIVFEEHLASAPGNASTTRFEVAAPDRLSYVTRNGPAAIVIGARRWDRAAPGAPWQLSAQTPLAVTQPYWATPTNVHLIAPGVLAFLERRIPAWFRLRLAGERPTRLEMTAAAHFMVDRYVAFDGPVAISPPPSR